MARNPPEQLQIKHVVTCFLLRRSRILLLKRSLKVGTFKCKWAAVSGFIESDPDSQSLIEIEEETGLLPTDVKLLKTGNHLKIEDVLNHTCWIIHPYLYEIIADKPIRIDWEHSEYRWIDAESIGGFDSVPMLREACASVYEG